MLILSRKLNEKIIIGDDIEITMLGCKGDNVKLGVIAPKNVEVHRYEVYRKRHSPNGEEAGSHRLKREEL